MRSAPPPGDDERDPASKSDAREPLPAYDGVAELYDRAFSDIRVRRAELSWLDQRLAQLAAPPHLLEVGCGTGALLRHLAPRIAEGVGVDVSGEMLAHAVERSRALPKLSFVPPIRHQLPFGDNHFDVVVSFLSFRYLDWNRTFPEILRVLKPGGRFLMVDLVRARARARDALPLARSVVGHFLRAEARPGFRRDLAKLVRHPAWAAMLARHPMRWLSEYRDFFSLMLPAAHFEAISVLPKRRVVALDSGPLGG